MVKSNFDKNGFKKEMGKDQIRYPPLRWFQYGRKLRCRLGVENERAEGVRIWNSFFFFRFFLAWAVTAWWYSTFLGRGESTTDLRSGAGGYIPWGGSGSTGPMFRGAMGWEATAPRADPTLDVGSALWYSATAGTAVLRLMW